MRKFLQLSENIFVEVMTCAYKNVFLVAGTSLYVDASFMRETSDKPAMSPQIGEDKLFRFVMPGEDAQFLALYLDYMSNNLFWYRGFNCSHFAYENMQAGLLQSEGLADLPTFTMGNTDDTKTRWLPGCFDRSLSANVGISGMDHFTDALAMHEEVPLSVTVKVDVGLNSRRMFCWLNPGEQVVRGPLAACEFKICNMMWMKHGIPEQTTCDLRNDQLPPARPYNPSKDAIDDWWEICKPWIEANYVVRKGMTMTKLNLTGLAPPTYGVDKPGLL